jgi:uncharacterized protein (TIGR02246 family)
MMRMLMSLLALMAAVPAVAHHAGAERQAIEVAMQASATGWNAGNIDTFLAVYSDDPATSFTTSDGVARGKAGIRARYLLTYAPQFGGFRSAPPTELSFVFEDFRMLGPDHALLIARWKLVTHQDQASAKTGLTSLVFRREAGGWKIVADHSS